VLDPSEPPFEPAVVGSARRVSEASIAWTLVAVSNVLAVFAAFARTPSRAVARSVAVAAAFSSDCMMIWAQA